MAGGFGVTSPGGEDFEAKITPIVVISCILAASGGLMFGYDIGISGGVTSMLDFLKKFFPTVYKRQQVPGLNSNYCKYDYLSPVAHEGWRGLAARDKDFVQKILIPREIRCPRGILISNSHGTLQFLARVSWKWTITPLG
ncbi:hypothetical protein ACLB2K_037555 [Fragaria x ananassa]